MQQTSTVRYWETRRLVYNLILTAFFVAWIVRTWPLFRPALNLHDLFAVFVLALLANLCYSAAYLAELIVGPLVTNHMVALRRSVLVAGFVIAIVLENYWIADEILSPLR